MFHVEPLVLDFDVEAVTAKDIEIVASGPAGRIVLLVDQV